MKKSLAALLILGALIFFAYKTLPRSHFPVLKMGKISHRRMGESLAGDRNSPQLPSEEKIGRVPISQPISAQIWHDAMASDVPREISAYGSQENTPPDAHWTFIEGKSPSEEDDNGRVFNHGSFNSKINSQGEGKSGNLRNKAKRSSAAHRAQKRFHKNSSSDLESEKRLLNEWVKTGKLPPKAVSRKENRVSLKQRQKREKGKRRLSADPLSRAYDLARMKARKSSRKLKRSRRGKLGRKNHKGKSSRGRSALAKILGKGSLKAPKINKIPPNPWTQRRPPGPPEGQYISGGTMSPDEIASLRLPPRNTFSHKKGWATDGVNYYYRNGKREGALLNGHWIEIIPSGKKSFLYPSPEAKPIVLFQGHLWIHSEGESFIEQNGQALGKDQFLLWREKNPEASSPIIRYSSDLKRMAITSNKKTIVYDLTTGTKLGEF